jgi:hypothetical protein
MQFRRRDADDHGTNEWVLLADNGNETAISILDLCSEGFGYVVNWDDDNWGEADTLAEAKQIALGLIGATDTAPSPHQEPATTPRRQPRPRRGQAAGVGR